MSDNEALLNNELRQTPGGPSQRSLSASVLVRQKLRHSIIQMVIFNLSSLAFMAIHFFIFNWQNGKPVDETIPQNLSTALANILAIMAEIAILGALGVAYEQILHTFSQKRPVIGLEDILRTLNSSPWNLMRPKVIVWIIKVRELWLVSLLCAGIPFAIVFPPGALTIGFENAVSRTLYHVPTMNISDYGNGTFQAFLGNYLIDMTDAENIGNKMRPRLTALASQVLSSGKPVRLDSPCGSSCEYRISFEGPRFQCQHVEPGKAQKHMCPVFYMAEDGYDPREDDQSARTKNSFRINWASEVCDNRSWKTLNCITMLVEYNLHIRNSRDASQSVTVKIENEREFWNETAWIQTQFLEYFTKGPEDTWPSLANESMRADFTNAQAFAIRSGAVQALEGEVWFEKPVLFGNASDAVHSPYLGMDKFNTKINVTPEKIERYLQDVVVSTVSLGLSKHNGGVKARYDDKLQEALQRAMEQIKKAKEPKTTCDLPGSDVASKYFWGVAKGFCEFEKGLDGVGSTPFDSYGNKAYPGNIINNEFVPTSKTLHSINPSTGEALWEVPCATRSDVDKAVQHARTAFKSWSRVPFDNRAKMLVAYADAIEAEREELEKLLVKEQGKPLGLAKTEFDMSLRWLRAFATMEVKDEVLDDNEDRTITQTFPPLGVCCGIVPWNWPVLLGLGKIGPALITGNVIIVKPSPFTPYCDLKLGEIGTKIFPPGVLQVISGDDSLGPMLTEHPDIDKIAFTGSIETGKRVMQSCAKTLKRVTLELGGNDPAIICDDVDIDAIVPKIATLVFLNSGQICMLIKRIYVHENIYDKFRDALVTYAKTIKVGDGFEPDVLIGPLQNSMQYEKLKDLYMSVNTCNWKPALEGRIVPESKGYFVTPSIIDNPPDDSKIVVEEPFGPIVPLLKWSSEDEVLDRANDSKCGLGASVWCKDLDRAERMARCLSAGSVWINSHFDVAPNVPFGGHKWSGIGSEWGMTGLKAYCNSQSLWKWKK
ncbi:unnamed protein product [Fusarium equiseti]|uniref:aldehyde dehydrogenase (NAD(+)) n=1 Tax=Fusarium equiseti TaxID=61235 RepID=A0A8J2IWW6_FUSEQ|nr:unnamed protein product [Fusarium equiseti]